ncbi:MAG: hypothetical protein EA357_00870 [Micavibrio sp.]|nr:MAG: hypothetical protein EA357_00870 [Micavibrio sp.]
MYHQNYDQCFQTPQKRWIFVPTDECRDKGKSFTDLVLKKWSPPCYFFHLQPGGHIAALEEHGQNSYFAKIDLRRFFDHISKNRIIRALKEIGIGYQYRAKEIAEWSVVVSKEDRNKRILPYGFVQSQMLASLCLDKSAIGSFLKNGISENTKVSCYVDDIIISSNDREELAADYGSLVSAVSKAKFSINEEKSHRPQDRSTAFNVNFGGAYMRITEERFFTFKEAVQVDGRSKRTDAIKAYVTRICPDQGEELKAILIR